MLSHITPEPSTTFTREKPCTPARQSDLP